MEARTQRNVAIDFLIKSLGLILAGMLFGGFLALRLHGQTHSNALSDREQIGLTIKVGNMEAAMIELTRKMDALKSEADTTEAMGAGIGLAITGLQLLGFFARGRRNGLDGGGN